jgi:hypothetical protein
MTGKNGVFNPGTGAFRVQSEGCLYRDVVIKTFIYEYTKSKQRTVKVHEKVDKNENYLMGVATHTPRQTITTVDKVQAVPVLDKLTAAIGGLANQAIARSPFGSDLTGKFFPPVVIPPPLMRVPVFTGTPIYQPEEFHSKTVHFQDKITPKDETKETVLLDGWETVEKVTSRVTFSTAIESYDIGAYDYMTGDGVYYTVNLAVRDITIGGSATSSSGKKAPQNKGGMGDGAFDSY